MRCKATCKRMDRQCVKEAVFGDYCVQHHKTLVLNEKKNKKTERKDFSKHWF